MNTGHSWYQDDHMSLRLMNGHTFQNGSVFEVKSNPWPIQIKVKAVFNKFKDIIAGFPGNQVKIYTGLQINVRNWKLFFLFLNQNICCGYTKELS